MKIGHWETATIHGSGKDSLMTVDERTRGLVKIFKIMAAIMKETNRASLHLMARQLRRYTTITTDNSGEFHV